MSGRWVRCYPRDDDAFREYVSACESELGELGELGERDAFEPASLQRLIRRLYPQAVVRRQTDLAATHQPPTWYVFREGQV
jgi:hypothetical protein